MFNWWLILFWFRCPADGGLHVYSHVCGPRAEKKQEDMLKSDIFVFYELMKKGQPVGQEKQTTVLLFWRPMTWCFSSFLYHYIMESIELFSTSEIHI